MHAYCVSVCVCVCLWMCVAVLLSCAVHCIVLFVCASGCAWLCRYPVPLSCAVHCIVLFVHNPVTVVLSGVSSYSLIVSRCVLKDVFYDLTDNVTNGHVSPHSSL